MTHSQCIVSAIVNLWYWGLQLSEYYLSSSDVGHCVDALNMKTRQVFNAHGAGVCIESVVKNVY